MTVRVILLLCFYIYALFGSAPLLAKTEGIVQTGLRAGWSTAPGTYTAAIDIELASGWKTYWRNPGAAGLAPQFDFANSRNLKTIELIWPAPKILGPSDMWSLGYSGQLVLPMEIKAIDPAQPVELEITASLGICEDICMPAELSFSGLLLPENQKRDPKIMAALANIPYSRAEADLKELNCSMRAIEDAVKIDVALSMPSIGTKEILILEYLRPDHWIVMQRPVRKGESLVSSGLLYSETGHPPEVLMSKLNVTVIGSDYAVDAGPCAP